MADINNFRDLDEQREHIVYRFALCLEPATLSDSARKAVIHAEVTTHSSR